MLKKINWWLVGIYTVFLGLAITFFFTDLNISKTLYTDQPSFIVVLFAAIGEFPIYLGPILFGLTYGTYFDGKVKKILMHLVGLAFTYVGLFRLTKGIYTNFYHVKLAWLQFVLLAVVSLLIYLLLVTRFMKMSDETINKLKDIAFIAFIVSAASFISIEIIKRIWGRQRFFTFNGDYAGYSNFLTIKGIKQGLISDEYRSFPSGHTNSATCLLALTLIPARFSKKKIWKYLATGVAVAYIISMAFARIIIGAHYASDTLFGFGLNFTILVITYHIFKKKGWLYARND